MADLDILDMLLEGMDVPDQRRSDLRWLSRNLGINNSGHPNLETAMRFIKAQLRQG